MFKHTPLKYATIIFREYTFFFLFLITYLKSPENFWKAGGPARKATSATSANPNTGTCIL